MLSPGRCSRPACQRVMMSWSVIAPTSAALAAAEIEAIGSGSPSICGRRFDLRTALDAIRRVAGVLVDPLGLRMAADERAPRAAAVEVVIDHDLEAPNAESRVSTAAIVLLEQVLQRPVVRREVAAVPVEHRPTVLGRAVEHRSRRAPG